MNGGQETSIYLKDKMFSTTGAELSTTVGISFEAGMTRNSDSVMWISSVRRGPFREFSKKMYKRKYSRVLACTWCNHGFVHLQSKVCYFLLAIGSDMKCRGTHTWRNLAKDLQALCTVPTNPLGRRQRASRKVNLAMQFKHTSALWKCDEAWQWQLWVTWLQMKRERALNLSSASMFAEWLNA